MLKLIFMSLSNIVNINFLMLNHPMSMMMMIILQTLLIGLMMGMMMESFWLSYILFLTFLGGMLVLFIYITSITSNEMFYLNSKNLMATFTIVNVFIMIMMIMDKIMIIDFLKNTETLHMYMNVTYKEMTMSLYKLYNNPTFIITMMMMIYLFLTLLVVVSITNINQGPIRKL